ncbi:MAG: PQQ-binding-like beta-propeller repeat protein [Fimbriimonas sp.]|nr:PQQ-binding-like beta-propeller repeat protein [Fimbriimonas sp.]
MPKTLTIPAGATSAIFTILTLKVATQTAVKITATLVSASVNATLNIGLANLTAVTLSPATVVGGAASTGTATISAAAPTGGLVVNLASNGSTATVPGSVTIPAGATSASFAVSTQPVSVRSTPSITGTFGSTSIGAKLTIVPPSMVGFALNPSSVVGGSPSTGAITLNGPAASRGYGITLVSDSSFANMASNVQVLAGATNATFTINTAGVGGQTVAVITGTDELGGVMTSKLTITVTPGLANSAWPKFRGNLANTGLGTGHSAAGTFKWGRDELGRITSKVVPGPKGLLYFGTETGMLCAVGTDGVRRWAFKTGGAIRSARAFGADGTIYFGSEDYNFYALKSDGTLKWKFLLFAASYISPAISQDGVFYLGTEFGFFAVK